MEPAKKMVVDGDWDRLPEEVISLIVAKVAETSEAPLVDLRSLQLCKKVTKRMSSSHTVTNRFNLEHHFKAMIEGGNTLGAYYQTIDWF
jgi:hypothetical protein